MGAYWGDERVQLILPASTATGGATDPTLQEKSVTPSESAQTIKPDSGYDGLSQVNIAAIQTETKEITANGTVPASNGKYIKSVIVNVQPKLQTKDVTPSKTAQTITPDNGKDGLSSVTVAAVSAEAKQITANGTYTPEDGTFFDEVTVHVPTGEDAPDLQQKTVTPSTTVQTIKPDSGYDGLSQVTVGAIQTETKTATPSASSQTISPSSGTYLSKVTVAAVPTETKTITENGTFSAASNKWWKTVTVNVPNSGGSGGLPDTIVAGDTPILGSFVGKTVSGTTDTATGLQVTVPKTGTYRFYIAAVRSSSYSMGSSGTPTITLYKNGASASEATTVPTTNTSPISIDLECAANDVIEVYAKGAGSSYSAVSVAAICLVCCIDA